MGAIAGVALWVPLAYADTLNGALILAYQNNPTLNAQRASVRATDESVPQALSGYRPRVTFNGTVGSQYSDTTTRSQTLGIGNTYTQLSGNMTPSSLGVTATQTLYNGFQTANRTRQAESQVQAARETLRISEQAVLLSAVIAYMNLLRDSAILPAAAQRRGVAGTIAPDA
jgi:outer membrane protein